MKTIWAGREHFTNFIKSFAYGLLGLGSIFIGTHCLQAQSTAQDSIVQLTAEAQGLQRVPPDQVPARATFWYVIPLARNGCISIPMPVCPNPSLPIYQAADGQFIVDEGAGQTPTEQQAEAQINSVVNLINQIQGLHGVEWVNFCF